MPGGSEALIDDSGPVVIDDLLELALFQLCDNKNLLNTAALASHQLEPATNGG